MFKHLGKIVLMGALGMAPVCLLPMQAHAQNDDRQRAYQAGYQNGVNDHEHNKSLNLKTDKWHGENLQAYERGYEDGYRGVAAGGPFGAYPNNREGSWNGERGYEGGNAGNYGQNDAARQAYQAGFQNGVNDREHNKSLNLKTDKWHGENLTAYEQGYQDGYRNGGNYRR